MSDALARARADLRAGHAWKARDRLTGLLTHRQDDEVLDLLAEAHHRSGNLPAAGALWSLTCRDDDEAREAIAAWRERYGNAEARWHSIPAPVRRAAESAELQRRSAAAQRAQMARREYERDLVRNREDYRMSWRERAVGIVAATCFLGAIGLMGLGAWTVVQWLRH